MGIDHHIGETVRTRQPGRRSDDLDQVATIKPARPLKDHEVQALRDHITSKGYEHSRTEPGEDGADIHTHTLWQTVFGQPMSSVHIHPHAIRFDNTTRRDELTRPAHLDERLKKYEQ
jgi:hypothetical protein